MRMQHPPIIGEKYYTRDRDNLLRQSQMVDIISYFPVFAQ